jgi:hypothetical protein
MLNRPFRNVGELAYTFRDLPWKSLDFSSENSADSALLDLFTLTEADQPVVEDRINLGRAPEPVLSALLINAPLDAVETGSFNTTQAAALATAFRTLTGGIPTTQDFVLKGLGPLSGDYTNPSSSTVIPDSAFGSADNARIKARREAVARVLGPIADDRTWVLTVDLIAQAGRFAPGATDAARFVVQGERRYWLHLAIDRYTGEIVSRSMEAVQE